MRNNILKQSKAILNLVFSFSKTRCLTKTKEPTLLFCLFITSVRCIYPFPKEISTNAKTASSRILSQIANSNFYGDNRYDKYASLIIEVKSKNVTICNKWNSFKRDKLLWEFEHLRKMFRSELSLF